MKLYITLFWGLLLISNILFSQNKPELVLPLTHSASTNIIRYSYDNQYLLTGSDDKTVKIWDVSSGKLLHDLKGHTGGIIAASFSKDNAYVLSVGAEGGYSGGTDKSARLWKVSTGELVNTFEHGDAINFATFSNNGKLVATCSEDLTAKIWDPISGKLLFTIIHETKASITKIIFSPDDKIIVTSSKSSISIWDAATGKLLRSIKSFSTNDIGFTTDGKSLVEIESYSKDRNNKHSIVVWDIGTGTLKQTLKSNSDPVKFFTFSGDGKYLATSDNRKTFIWDLASGSIYKSFEDGNVAIFDKTSTYLIIFDGFDSKVYNLKTGAILNKFFGHITGIGPFVKSTPSDHISNDNTKLACFQGAHGDIVIFNFLTGEPYRKITNHTTLVKDVATSQKGNFIAYSIFDNGAIKVLDGNTGKKILELKSSKEFWFTSSIQISNDETKIIICDKEEASVFETQNGNLIKKIPMGSGTVNNYALTSPDDKLLITASKELKAWDLETGKLLYSLQGNFDFARNASFSKDGKFIGIPANRDLIIIEAATGKIINTFKTTISSFKDCSFSPDGNYLVAASYKDGYIYDLKKEKMIRQLNKHSENLNTCKFSPDGKYIITTAVNGEAIVWDAKDATTAVSDPWKDTTTKIIAKINLESNAYRFSSSFSFTKNWMVINANNEIAIYDIKTMKKLLGWVAIDQDDYVMYLPNNYYSTTPNAARWVNWKIGSTLYDFDQWDIKYNRPDIILRTLRNKDTSLINAYQSAYIKRLKKLDLDSSMFQDDYKVPEVNIASNYPANVTQTNKVNLKITAKETLSNTYLRKIYVTVNGNPVYGKNGYDIPKKNANEASLEVPIPLNTGNNQVRISCLNNRGAESLRKKINITYTPKTKPEPKVWYVGIGVSKYKNEKYDLTYASKDINDISTLLQSKYKSYQPILLLNENATYENIKAINHQLIKETKPDDIVIISLSGHGLIDKDFSFYFASHDINFETPSQMGLSMDDIELMLDNVVASNKLILMDACHSGEIDAEETIISTTSIQDTNVKKVARGIIINENSGLSGKSTFELLQELFTSNNSATGATIISAAGGNEYAFEGQEWNNGVFTYSILSALSKKSADANNDGIINITELQKYVSNQVQVLTGGKQKPTSRQVNYENDWIIW